MKKKYTLTTHGRRELETELADLIATRPAIADRIAEARSFGDLSENAEYSAARDEQARVETRIAEIQEILHGAEIIAKNDNGIVSLGETVILGSDGLNNEYKIVGAVEADPLNGRISDESPLGQALLGKKVGDSATIDTPKGAKTFKIVKILE